MRISVMAAVAENGVIGRDGRLPWSLPEDLRRFRRLTTPHAMIMGRKTYLSNRRPLPERLNIVLSGTLPPPDRPDVRVVATWPEALAVAADYEAGRPPEERAVFVIGGTRVFALGLAAASRFYLTRVLGSFAGDTYFPPWDQAGWTLTEAIEHPQMVFETWDRLPPAALPTSAVG